jgi:hypothetical protein
MFALGRVRRGTLHQTFLWLLIIVLSVPLAFWWQQSAILWFSLRWVVRRLRNPWNWTTLAVLSLQIAFFLQAKSGVVLLAVSVYFLLQQVILSWGSDYWRRMLDGLWAAVFCIFFLSSFHDLRSGFLTAGIQSLVCILMVLVAELFWERRYKEEHDVF